MISVRCRLQDPIESSSYEELAHLIIQGRDLEVDQLLNPRSLNQITPPFSLKGLDPTCERLMQAMDRKEIIGILSDHDCDGQTACAVLYSALTEVFSYPLTHIMCFIGHRTEEGYGITEKLTDRILASDRRPSVIITADCGSSDQKNIVRLSEEGIDVLVTDHHQIPTAGPPLAAYAVINPQQEGCAFPDKHIAGCGMAWFVMCALRSRVMALSPEAPALPSMAPYLDFVAIGTLADCVSLTKSANNRIILRYGLERIRQGLRPCWRVLRALYSDPVSCEFLSFKVIPLINADGRLSNALGGVGFLTSQDMVSAQEQLAMLIETNDHRKHLQKMQLVVAKRCIDPKECALVLNLSTEGHHGIHGVTASRLSEESGKLTMIFSQIDSDPDNPILSGSVRSPEGTCIKSLLDRLHHHKPELMIRYGGHSQAAGLSLYVKNFEIFKKNFLQLCEEDGLGRPQHGRNTITFDGILSSKIVSDVNFMTQLDRMLEPFGKDFKRPVFGIWGEAIEGRVMGAEKNHLQMSLQLETGAFKVMVFFCAQAKEFVNAHTGRKKLWIGEMSFETYKKSNSYMMILKGVFDPDTATWSTAQELDQPARRLQEQKEHASCEL